MTADRMEVAGVKLIRTQLKRLINTIFTVSTYVFSSSQKVIREILSSLVLLLLLLLFEPMHFILRCCFKYVEEPIASITHLKYTG